MLIFDGVKKLIENLTVSYLSCVNRKKIRICE